MNHKLVEEVARAICKERDENPEMMGIVYSGANSVPYWHAYKKEAQVAIRVCMARAAEIADSDRRYWRDASEQAGGRGHHSVFVQAGNVADALEKTTDAIKREGGLT